MSPAPENGCASAPEPTRTTVRDTLAQRVSCRAYQPKPVPEAQVTQIMVTALLAALAVFSHLTSAAAQAGQGETASTAFELRKGERYFRVDGTPAFVLGRNPVGVTPEAFAAHFEKAAAAGERFMRIHFTYSQAGEKAGEIHPDMLKSWDAVLDAAEKHRLAVLPVLGVWADWNDGSHGETWHSWEKNPFNAARNGPVICWTTRRAANSGLNAWRRS